MPHLDRLSSLARNSLLALPVRENESAPFTPLPKPLVACRLTVVTTAGLHLRGDHPFVPGDQSYRVIPADSPASEILQSHSSIGFDRVPTQRDLNIVYPLDRLRELVQRGDLGALGPTCYSFMGAQRDPGEIERRYAPEVAARLREEGVDAVLLTPT